MGEQSKSIKVIYIAGYGRSGSTILDMLLNSPKTTYGLGELTNLFSEYKSGNLPPFWRTLVDEVGKSTGIPVDQMHNITKNNESKWFGGASLEYKRIWSTVFEKLNQKYPGIYIDSSKTTRLSFSRPRLLREIGLDVKVIFLIRDYPSVLRSVRKGTNKSLERGEPRHGRCYPSFFTFVSWGTTNLKTSKMCRSSFVGSYLFLKYEELITRFPETIFKISKFIGVSYQPEKLLNCDLKKEVDIGISGNRLRRNQKVIFTTKNSNKVEMSSLARRINRLFINGLIKAKD